MADGDSLENCCRRKTTVGSNPTPSANLKLKSNKMLPIKFIEIGGICVFANGLLTNII